MADVGDDLLDGDLDETTFGDLDGEEEDALLADDDYEPYQSTRRTVFSGSTEQGERRTDMYHIVNQVQDVAEGDEIIEDDVLELAVVDELESELDNGQLNNQTWAGTSSRTVDTVTDTNGRREPTLCVTSSTSSLVALGGESDEEESDGRGSRFKTERTNIISLKGVSSGKSLSEIPDSLDNVKTVMPSSGLRRGGPLHRGGKGNIRGRLGPIQRGGGVMRGGFGPMRRPQAPPPGHKIHINPHFRGGMHQSQPVWDNERLPPPPGCESFNGPGPSLHNQDGSWMGPMPHHMGKPPFPPQHPGPPVQYQNVQVYPSPQQPQGCEDQYPPMMNTSHPNNASRIVQFSENSQLVTVENQHFQGPAYDQNCSPMNNQFPPHHNVPPHYNNNNTYPNQFNNSQPRPSFPPQPFPVPNAPQNYPGYPQQEYHPPHPNPPQFQNFENNWSSPPQTMNNQQNQWGSPHPQPHPHPEFGNPQPQFLPRTPFHQQNFRPPLHTPIQRGLSLKRIVPRQPLNNSVSPVKQMRFEHGKQKTPPSNLRSNLQEIKTVDNLPDTTTAQEPEPEIEEDEETKQYRMKIAEQKALREKILKEKEARRLAAIIEKQKKQENKTTFTSVSAVKPVSALKPQPQHQPQQPQHQLQQPKRQLQQLQRQQQPGPGRGRGRGSSTITVNQQPLKPKAPGEPVVQIQQMLGTMYKIVKVRTKEGAIVTRKTPLVMNSAGTKATPMKTVSSANPAPTQRRVVLPQASTRNVGNMVRGGRGGVRGGSSTVRMISAKQTPQGRTLFTVQTSPSSTLNTVNKLQVQGPQRVVIDKRPINPTVKMVATPSIPVSTLVTVDNLSLSTSKGQIQKLAKQVGNLSSIKHEPDLKRATLRFKNPKEAEQFFLKFHRKMIDLSRISVTVVAE